MRNNIAFHDRIIEGFEPKFGSISKDCKRYFDALLALNEEGIVGTNDVMARSGEGSLWISYQYIDKRLLDLVEADLRRDVTSRDFYGPFFENTRLVLERLLAVSAHKSVITIYKAAIAHRLKAAQSEIVILKKSKRGSPAQMSAAKWLKHYKPTLTAMIRDYGRLLKTTNLDDPELENIKQALRACDSP